MRNLYRVFIWAGVIFYIFGAIVKLFFGGAHIVGIPPSAWVNQGTIVFLLFAVICILLHYLPELGE